MKEKADPLITYKGKRDFARSPEPEGSILPTNSKLSFVIQKHAARALHYDFRLELDGTLKSWAVPKGPSLDPRQKRLAVKVEDHPIAYAQFEGVIPPGQYGAGSVIVWDRGNWEPLVDPRQGLEAGNLKFLLHGEKLKGKWVLVRMRQKAEDHQEPWLLIKEQDDFVRTDDEYRIVEALPDSVFGRAGMTMPAGAKPSSLPRTFAPQLATLVSQVPREDGWSYEIKFDGYRILARIDGGNITLFTRNGIDWSAKLSSLVTAIKSIGIPSGWLDGEVVKLGEKGTPDFIGLQNSFQNGQTEDLLYFVFDIPFYAGYDLRESALADRRSVLSNLLHKASQRSVLLSEDFAITGSDMLESSCKLGLEGIIGKRKDAPYVSGRSAAWVKVKCYQRQEFVIIGYTESAKRDGIAALLLATYDDHGSLQYAGKVGTGFDTVTARLLRQRLSALKVPQSPLGNMAHDAHGHWVKPVLAAEVSFQEWTKKGVIRQAVFKGLREDKPVAAIIREHTEDGKSAFKISNPGRVIDSSAGITKLDLVNYYKMVGSRMLPHLAKRPISLLRAPAGIEEQMFFQKHADTLHVPGLRKLDPALDPGHQALLAVDNYEGLIGAAQINAIEFHTWNATETNIDKPDRMIFDLDPGQGLEWASMLEAASLTRKLLEEVGLQCFLKTSGGKGLHIVVPLKPKHDWDTVKNFSKAVTQYLAVTHPSLFVSLSGPKNRIGKVFVDYIRNGRGATTVAAFSARARPGMGVSMPCFWQELSALKGGDHWTIANVQPRLATGEDPWDNYAKVKQIIKSRLT